MSLKSIFLQFKWKFLITLFLVLSEAVLELFFPLFIGWAIDDVLKNEYRGCVYLMILGVFAIIAAGGRRFFDSRFYGEVFEKLGFDLTNQSNASTSKKSARLGMLSEVIEFLEHSIPSIIISFISLVGTLVIVATLNTKIFIGCLIALVVVFLFYFFTRNKTIFYNTEYNNELERQVDVISKKDIPSLKIHLKNLMKWNIKLSDLEAINFSLAWMIMMGFLVLSIIWAVDNDTPQYGKIFALVMYIFEYIESVIVLPFFYQQWLRLKEISVRLGKIDSEEEE